MEDGSNVFVIYHKQCSDGFCSAWVIRKVYPNAQFFPAAHGTLPPDIEGKDVVMVDFASYKREAFLAMKKQANSLVVLDHHKTAADKLGDLPFCHFNMNKSGARIAWDYFFKKKEMPWLVGYTEDRDLNKWVLPHSREVNAALSSYRMNFWVWDTLEKIVSTQDLRSSRSEFVQEGAAIYRYENMQVESIVNHARESMLGEHKVLAANTPVYFGDVASTLAKNRSFGIAWHLREDGKYVYSLRSEEKGIDVSQVAEKYGGGGHLRSSGFESDEMVLRHVG